MTKKTIKELECEIKARDTLEAERKTSDLKYAPMWVKILIIWAGTIFGGAVLLALARLLLK